MGLLIENIKTVKQVHVHTYSFMLAFLLIRYFVAPKILDAHKVSIDPCQ